MRPILLKMTAFGPYKNTEVIDFTELGDHRLFMISGQTGAGKTTIFDGICFALYGSASGSDRDQANMLRSDFADDDTHTSVEFIFELRGRIYRILRQMGHVKKGNVSRTGDKYEFFERIGDVEIPCVDRQIVTEINQKVEELIGLNQDQFKQIVMLPQGEFRKLLTSETTNKEAILRRLFKTESYQKISEKAKEKLDHIREIKTRAEQVYINLIQHIHANLKEREGSLLFNTLASDHYNVHQILQGLDEEMLFYHQEIEKNQQAYDQAYLLHDRKQAEYHKAKTLNDRFDELREKEQELAILTNQKQDMTLKEQQLKDAERAQQMTVYENNLHEWTREEQDKEQAFKSAVDHLKQIEKTLQKAEAVYLEEKNQQSERDEITKQLDRFIEFRPVVQQIDDEKKELSNLKTQIQQTEQDLNQKMENLHEAKQIEEQLVKSIQNIDQSVRFLPDKKLKLNQMREQVKTLNRYIKLNQQQSVLENELETKKSKWQQQKAIYETLEQEWFEHQASLLAGQLEDGEPCPVCGSLHHPSKASVTHHQVTKEQLDQQKLEVDKYYQAFQTEKATYQAQANQLTELRQEILAYDMNPEEAEHTIQLLTVEGKQLAEEVKKLDEQYKTRDTLQEKLELEKKKILQLEKDKEQLGQWLNQFTTEYETKQAVQREKLRQIPVELQDLPFLEKQIQTLQAKKEAMVTRWEEAQKQYNMAKESHTKAIQDKKHLEKSWQDASLKRQKAEEDFMKALKKANFASVEHYQQAKLTELQFEALKQEIEQFKQRFVTLTEQVAELKAALKDKQKVDLTKLEEELKQLKDQYEKALHILNQSKDYYREAQALREKISEQYNRVEALEKQLALITDLYNLLRGQNSQRMSFERYLQIEYLEQIINAANHRLKEISHGQFMLLRSDRQESHGRQSGLALDVYDAYTGQTRDVKTLSGGEKFNASLCLALGMSDVIQSFRGNINIDTMFIDEGFGSLDEETLNKSVETLLELQETGRMIGIISHVQELKQMFSAVLEVKKTKEGYSRTQFVLK